MARANAGFVTVLAVALLAARCPGATSLAKSHQQDPNEKLGTVHFSTSCNQMAQPEFDRAVALLHSFQFSRAIQGFYAALRLDPICGMAHWGIALSEWGNPFAPGAKDKSQLLAGQQSVTRGLATGARPHNRETARERAYVAAVAHLYRDSETTPQQDRVLAYRDAMADLAAKYPDDQEAQIFYALALAASEDPADKTYAGRLKAGAILEHLFAQQPQHPGLAHYIIHTYDVPALASHALDAARRYSQIAPDTSHALHMPSHTFTRMGYWQESIAANVAAAAAARREGQTGEELHATDYQIYAYLQAGEDAAAQRLVDSLPEMDSRFDPKIVVSGAASPSAAYFALAAIPARFALERGDWKQAATLLPRETPFPQTAAMTWFAHGYAAARLGQAPAAREAAAALEGLRQKLLQSGENYWALQVQIQQIEVSSWAALAEGNKPEALRQARSAAELEDGTEKSAVTPGPLAPARELLGEMLLEAHQPALALEQFQATLKKEPNRFRALYGVAHAAHLSGHREASQRYFRELLKECAHADQPGRPEILEARRDSSGK